MTMPIFDMDPKLGVLLRIAMSFDSRVIPIVEDEYVVLAAKVAEELGLGSEAINDPKAALATGFLKVTPAHDPNDWEIGLRHELPVINVMAPDGSISSDHGFDDHSADAQPFLGMSREDARTAIVAWFEQAGLLENVREYEHAVGHSYRSHVPIEPYLSDQWYVRVTDDRLRGGALRAMREEDCDVMPEGVAPRSGGEGDAGLTFFPDRYAKTFRSWHENLRDWCISRQLWWGHRIPVWMRTVEPDPEAHAVILGQLDEAELEGLDSVAIQSPWTERGCAHHVRRIAGDLLQEQICLPALEDDDQASLAAELEMGGFEQDPDVLDTWFSSALWPLSTMGWPNASATSGAKTWPSTTRAPPSWRASSRPPSPPRSAPRPPRPAPWLARAPRCRASLSLPR